MFKQIMLLVFSLLISVFANAQYNYVFKDRQEQEKQREIYKNNNIRGYVDRKYNIEKGKESDTIFNYILVNIDTSGNIIQKASFDKYRKISRLYRYEYNNKNERIKSYLIINDKLLYESYFYYDISNKLIEVVENNEFGSINLKQNFYYTDKNQIKSLITVGPSGNVVSESEYVYTNGKIKETKSYKIKNEGNETKKRLYSILKLSFENDKIINIQVSIKEEDFELMRNFNYNIDLISKINETENDKISTIKREYLTFEQKTRNIERWLAIPDYSKYFIKEKEYSKNFKYTSAPYFPKGKQALIDFINENIKYPKKAKKAGIQGLVIVGFMIDQNGSIGNIRIHKSVDYELDDAAIELVKKMPKWKPALNENGKPTMSSFLLPVNYVIE